MNEIDDLAQRIRRLEDTEAIKQLVARYAFAADDRDIQAIRNMFTDDGCFRSVNGSMNAQGIEEVMKVYHARLSGMGHSFHVAHDHVIEFESDTVAKGRVASHAEVIRNGEPYWVALRYEDSYVLDNDCWRFRERALSFYYYMKVADYLTELPGTERMRGMAQPMEADWPERTETYIEYQRTQKVED